MADITVGEETFEVFPLTGRQGLVWPYRLAKYMQGFVYQTTASSMDVALEKFFEECSESAFIDFAEGMFETVHFNGKSMKVMYTTKFAGNIAPMYKLLIAVCKFHFQDFFSELQNSEYFGMQQEKTETSKVKIRD